MSRIEILRQYVYEDVNETEYEAVAVLPTSKDLALFACPKCHNDIHLNVEEDTITIADGKITIDPDVYCRRCNKYIIVEKSRLEMITGKSDLELGTVANVSAPVDDADDEDDDEGYDDDDEYDGGADEEMPTTMTAADVKPRTDPKVQAVTAKKGSKAAKTK